MTATMRRRATARTGVAGVVLALLATLVTPTIVAAAETPGQVTSENATLLQITGSPTEPVTLGLLAADGTPALPGDTVITVAGTEAFPAAVDVSATFADGGHVEIAWDAVTLPGGAAAGASADPGPQIIVTSEDGAGWLLGSATDAPTTLKVPTGAVLPTQWQFTAPGSYTVTATATLLDANQTILHTSAPTTYIFQVTDPTLPAPTETDPPAETPAPDPSGSPVPTESPAPSPTPGPTSAPPTPTPTVPLPAGQSDKPAPDSRDKRVIGAVHTDAVSAYLDAGELVLETKADIDVTGDGVIDLGSRLASRDLLFHLSDHGKITVPDLPAYSFLGQPGSTIWMAPQTQNHQIIWPGFSTEDPNLSGKVQNNTFQVRLLNTEGPGNAEVYMQDGAQVKRIFSSTTALPAWSIGVPQHTHMNWAFSKPGTYTFTFEMSGVVDGRTQSASNDYTFVVGDLDAHTQQTTTTLTAEPRAAAAGESVLLTAALDPAAATGAVQFRDLTTGALLGHTPVTDGTAQFRADALPPGEHRIVAEFVPTWNDDFVPSTSRPVTISVAGEVEKKPDRDDTTPIPDREITATQPGIGALITIAGKKTTPGGTLTVKLTDPALAGKWVSVWVPGQNPAWQGWTQADLNGIITAQVPDAIKPGAHRLVIETTADTLAGWDAFTVTGGGSGGTTPPPTPPTPPPPAPSPAPQAPGQTCTPGITLETGHIDAFYVSAANGKAVLQLMEDVTGHHVIREAETVLLKVKESAYRGNIPAGTPGAPSGYVLPLTQDPGLIWPGWDTNRTASSGYTDVSINVTGVNGPGRVYLSSQGSFGGTTSLLQGGGYTLPGTIREATPAHTHAQWVFSEKGIYKLTAHAVATNPSTGQSLTTAAHTYVFQVGDVPLGDAFCGLRSAGAADAEEVNAAVNQAAADAVAAAQAAAAEEAAQNATTANLTPRGRKDTNSSSQEGGLLDSLFGDEADPAVVAGLLTGGGLIVLGIIGATIWYVRRLRVTTPPAADSGTGT